MKDPLPILKVRVEDAIFQKKNSVSGNLLPTSESLIAETKVFPVETKIAILLLG